MEQKKLMDFGTFKEAVVKDILSYMPPEMRQLEMLEQPVKKVNIYLTGLTFKKEGIMECPTIYVEELYEDYREHGDLQKALQKGVKIVCAGFAMELDVSGMLDKDRVKENVVLQIINTEMNKELLLGVPHRNFQDLSIIYYITKAHKSYTANVIIQNGLLELLEMDEQQLYNFALANTKKLFPTIIHAFLPEELAPLEYNMFFVSNTENNRSGSACILYEEVLCSLEEKIHGNFYILPVSKYEMLVVSAENHDLAQLKQMVKEVNDTALSPSEVLSYNVYYYDTRKKQITIASN